MKREPPVVFRYLNELPTTALGVVVTLTVIVATTARYLFGPPLADLGPWLTFCGSLSTIYGAVVVGKRFATDPAVVAAEAASRQDPPPQMSVSAGGDVDVIPASGASQAQAGSGG